MRDLSILVKVMQFLVVLFCRFISIFWIDLFFENFNLVINWLSIIRIYLCDQNKHALIFNEQFLKTQIHEQK